MARDFLDTSFETWLELFHRDDLLRSGVRPEGP